MAIVIVNGQEVEIGDDEQLNGIQVAERVGEHVPHYCWHPGLSVVASCRMCLVETGRRNPETGEITMVPKLVPGCQTPATDNSVFVTNSEKVKQARAMVEEDLLIRHPIDCPICDKAGECQLQDYHFEYGQSERRADLKPFTSRRRDLGETVTLFVDRCVVCTRCVRFTREISGGSELMVVNRGAHEEIDVFPGYPLGTKLSGNVVDLCPVGALGDRDFLYSQRVWFMKSHDGVCAGCSSGCSIRIEENQDRIYRLKPRVNPEVNGWWLCDEGRYGFKHVHDLDRLTQPRLCDHNGSHDGADKCDGAGQMVVGDWSQLPAQLDARLKSAGRIAVVLSPFLTVEEAYLLATYARSIDSHAVLAVGFVPVVGEDESFPNGFTIRAEKCPNRRGVEAIVSRLMGEVLSFEALPARLSEEKIEAVWVTGGYRESGWIDEAAADRIRQVPLLIVTDLFSSPLSERADVELPSVAFAERQGSYVSAGDRLQSFDWAVRPPQGVVSEGQLLWRMSGRQGLYDARVVMGELAREISYFAAAAGDIPATGVDLKANLLADV